VHRVIRLSLTLPPSSTYTRLDLSTPTLAQSVESHNTPPIEGLHPVAVSRAHARRPAYSIAHLTPLRPVWPQASSKFPTSVLGCTLACPLNDQSIGPHLTYGAINGVAMQRGPGSSPSALICPFHQQHIKLVTSHTLLTRWFPCLALKESSTSSSAAQKHDRTVLKRQRAILQKGGSSLLHSAAIFPVDKTKVGRICAELIQKGGS